MTSRILHLALSLVLLAGAVIGGFFVEWAALSALLVMIWASPILIGYVSGPIRLDRQDLLALGWLLWLLITLSWSMASDYSLATVYAMALLPAMFLAWRRWEYAAEGWPWILGLMWMLALVLALWGILGNPAANYVGKPDGPYIDPNVYAANLNLLWLPLTAYFLNATASRPRWLEGSMLLVLATIALAFFISASRGAGLAALLLFPFIFWHARRQPGFWERLAKWMAVSLLGYAISSWGLEEDVAGRLVDTVQSGDSARIMLWQSTWDMILRSPLLGTGFGSFRLLYPLYRDPSESTTGGYWSHNDYLQIWQEGGLISLLFVLTIVFFLVHQAWRALRQDDPGAGERLGLVAGCLAIFIHAGVNFLLYFPIMNLLIGLYWARVAVLGRGPVSGRLLSIPVRPAILRLSTWMAILISGYFLLTSTLIQSSVLFTHVGDYVISRFLPHAHHVAIAHWLSILRPNVAQPHLIMARIFDARLGDNGTGNSELDGKLFKEADTQFDEARKALPCLLPLGSYHVDFLLRQGHIVQGSDAAAKAIEVARENLACNPRHGLSLAYLALAQHADGDPKAARATLQQAYGRVVYQIEGALLIAVWLQIKEVPQKPEAVALTREIMTSLQKIEFNPAARFPQSHWDELMLAVDKLTRDMNQGVQ